MTDLMEKYMLKGELLSIYGNTRDTSKFSVGFIQSVSQGKVLINSINQKGEYDGYQARLINDIYLIEHGNAYLSALKDLISKTKHKKISYMDDIFHGLLDFAKENHLVVSIQLCESGYDDMIGYVDYFTNDLLGIDVLDENGDADGVAECTISSISIISCDGGDEQSLMK